MKRSRRSAFTLVDLAFALMPLGMVIGAAGMICFSSSKSSQVPPMENARERAQEDIDRIAALLTNAQIEERIEAPLSTGEVEFRRPAGYGQGGTVWGKTESIRFVPKGEHGEVHLVQDRGLASESVSEITSWVTAFAEGESANGMDDNGNGLVDEGGLWFTVANGTVNLGLSLERRDARGKLGRATVSATVTHTSE